MSTKRNFTEEDLLRHLYGETDADEAVAIEMASINDPEMQESMEDILAMQDALDKAELSPSSATIQNILDFSKNFHGEAAEAKKH